MFLLILTLIRDKTDTKGFVVGSVPRSTRKKCFPTRSQRRLFTQLWTVCGVAGGAHRPQGKGGAKLAALPIGPAGGGPPRHRGGGGGCAGCSGAPGVAPAGITEWITTPLYA
eukprot:8099448-Pyramimonas_sp.AAC.2